MPGLIEHSPCPERCPVCHERCLSAKGHTVRATAGKGFAELHSCTRHIWGSHADNAEAQRAAEMETKRELLEMLGKSGVSSACLEKVRRVLGVR